MPAIPEHAFRAVVFEALRSDFGNQWGFLKPAVARVARAREFYPPPKDEREQRSPVLDASDEERLRSLFWQLVAAGIMTVGFNSSNEAWPFMSLTEFGHRVVREDDSAYLPYDHAGYIASLKERYAHVPVVVEQAIGEATECLTRGTYWAATIMLGVASEATIRVLLDASARSITDSTKQKQFVSDTSGNTSRAFSRLEGSLRPLKPNLPRELADGLDTVLVGVFGLIRLSRNEAGHPTVVPMATAASVHAKLILFLEYAAYAGQLEGWLLANPR